MRELRPEEIDELVEGAKSWAYLTTLGPDGYPHCVALGYFRLDEDLYCGVRAGTQKLRNIERNPKVSLLLETGRASGQLAGVLFQGDASVIVDPQELLVLKQRLARQRQQPEPTEVAPGIAYIRVRPVRVRSWAR